MSGAEGSQGRETALISVRPDGYVDGASMSGVCDEELIKDAEKRGFEIRTVDRKYAKQVLCTFLPVNGGTTLPA